MKSKVIIAGLCLAVLTSVLLFSCQKEPGDNPTTSSYPGVKKRSTPRDPHTYCETNLKELGEGMLKLAKNSSTFRAKVYTEIDTKFDGDDNVLVKTLNDWYISNGSSLRAQLIAGQTSSKIALIDTALVAFSNIENGNSYYPQIYIPNYDSLKTAGQINVNQPILAVYVSGDDDVTSWVGYTWNSATQTLNTSPVAVTESYCRSHEVWVLSLNETVNNSGVYSAPGSGSPSTASCKTNARINQMQVKDRKESGLGGQSEVCYMSRLTFDNGKSPITNQPAVLSSLRTPGAGNFHDTMIRKYSKGEINGNSSITVNFNIETNWEYCDGVNFGVKQIFCIFEYDPWPAAKQSVNFDIDGNSTLDPVAKIEFRSGGGSPKNNPYASSNIDGFLFSYNIQPVSSTPISNSTISYNIQPF